MPRSAIGIGMLIGLLVGGAAGAGAGIFLVKPVPGGGSMPFVLGSFLALLGLSAGAVVRAVYSLAVTIIGRRPVRPDGPEADYREPPA
jgi:hypothetical protein